MGALEDLRDAMPESARDIKLNLEAVLLPGKLSPEQRWGVAVAVAVAVRSPALRDAIVEAAQAEVAPEVIEDARSAGVLMAMNNVYYRFRHMIGKPLYADKPARLRMNRLSRPAGSKIDLELYALAVSAIGGCQVCLQAHERAVLSGGLSEDHVHEAVRIAAVMQGAAVALEMGTLNLSST